VLTLIFDCELNLVSSPKHSSQVPASVAYEIAQCTDVNILTSTLVHKIIFDSSNTRTIGVQTSAGAFYASKETIICAGAYSSSSSPLVLELPDVGMNLHDHLAVPMYWKLKVQGGGLDTSPDAKLSAS